MNYFEQTLALKAARELWNASIDRSREAFRVWNHAVRAESLDAPELLDAYLKCVGEEDQAFNVIRAILNQEVTP
jgi:hypothetical protein